MELPHHRENNVPTRYLMPPSKTSSSRNGFLFFSFLFFLTTAHPQTSQAITKAVDHSPSPDGKALSMKAKCLETWRNQASPQPEASPLLTRVPGANGCFPCYQRREVIETVMHFQVPCKRKHNKGTTGKVRKLFMA